MTMARPEKKERNAEMYQRRKEGWTFPRLAEFYNMRKPTAFVIVKRLEKREKEEKLANA